MYKALLPNFGFEEVALLFRTRRFGVKIQWPDFLSSYTCCGRSRNRSLPRSLQSLIYCSISLSTPCSL